MIRIHEFHTKSGLIKYVRVSDMKEFKGIEKHNSIEISEMVDDVYYIRRYFLYDDVKYLLEEK